MRKVRGKHFKGESVTLDGNKFISCSFVECRLQYAGGYVDFVDCDFDGLQMEFSGPASQTVQLLSALGMLGTKTFVVSNS